MILEHCGPAYKCQTDVVCPNWKCYMSRLLSLLVCAGFLCGSVRSIADDAAAPPAAPAPPAASKHQLMKDCMAKQKASESGRSADDMRKSCKDVTKTEKQNQDLGSAPANTAAT
jgi:hypothetical protein